MMAVFLGKRMEVHCKHCMTPVDIWEPLKTYQSADSCKFYCDVSDVADRLEMIKGFIERRFLLKACDHLRVKYPDIQNFEAAINECFDIFDDLGTHATRD